MLSKGHRQGWRKGHQSQPVVFNFSLQIDDKRKKTGASYSVICKYFVELGAPVRLASAVQFGIHRLQPASDMVVFLVVSSLDVMIGLVTKFVQSGIQCWCVS